MKIVKLMAIMVASAVLSLPLATAVQAEPQRNGREQHGDQGRRMSRDRDWNNHEMRSHRYRRTPHHVQQPEVIYAPPLVYAPPVYQQPGLNLIIPLNIH